MKAPAGGNPHLQETLKTSPFLELAALAAPKPPEPDVAPAAEKTTRQQTNTSAPEGMPERICNIDEQAIVAHISAEEFLQPRVGQLGDPKTPSSAPRKAPGRMKGKLATRPEKKRGLSSKLLERNKFLKAAKRAARGRRRPMDAHKNSNCSQ